MTRLSIIIVPDPVLKQVAQPIENITDSVRQQAADMIETMYDAPGIGLAANQSQSAQPHDCHGSRIQTG
jgi:peptide deformylase